MAIGEKALTSSWWTADDWVDPEQLVITVDGTGAVEFTWEIGTPAGAAIGAPIANGTYAMTAPAAGYKCYFRVPSGSADLFYTKSSATPVDTLRVGYVYKDTSGSYQGFTQTENLLVGFDDLTAQSGTEPYKYDAYYPTVGIGLGSATAVDVSYLMLKLGRWTEGRTLRVKALKYAVDKSGDILDWDDLDGLTKTTAYTDVTIGVSDMVTLDITAIIEELQAVSGWTTDSPLQLHIRDTGSASTGKDATTSIDAREGITVAVVLLTSGGNPTPVPAEPL